MADIKQVADAADMIFRAHQGPCLVSNVFLKLENIMPDKIKVSEMGK